METIEQYISIWYVLSLIFGNDFLNKFVPFYSKMHNRFTVLFLGVVLAFLFHKFQMDSNEKIAISFLFAVTSYDFIVKPFKAVIEKKVKQFTEK